MGWTSAERDLLRAKDMRTLGKKARSTDAKRAFEEAADRLEARSARKVRKVGKRSKKRAKGRALG